ncbi:unnamed protein product [Caretta caretta]
MPVEQELERNVPATPSSQINILPMLGAKYMHEGEDVGLVICLHESLIYQLICLWSFGQGPGQLLCPPAASQAMVLPPAQGGPRLPGRG